VRPLVKPVDLTDAELDVLEMMATIDPMAALGSAGQHIPTNAVDGNSNATGLTDMKAMAPELDGSGQLICVIDTGMSFVKNALYGECTGINTPKGKCKVVAGYDFVGDAFTGLQTGPSAVRGGTPVRAGAGLGFRQQQAAGGHDELAWPGSQQRVSLTPDCCVHCHTNTTRRATAWGTARWWRQLQAPATASPRAPRWGRTVCLAAAAMQQTTS
jgi:hypothetical protein